MLLPPPKISLAQRRTPALVGVFLAAAMVFASHAQARPEYAETEEVECVTCHVNPRGGGKHNVIGKFYHATFELPADRSPETMAHVNKVVDEWMGKLLAQSPTVTWRYVDLAKLEDVPGKDYDVAADHVVLRRLAFDIRGAPPTEKDVQEIVSGKKTLEDKVDEYLNSKDFFNNFMLYHRDLLRPRSGDHNTTASLTKIRRRQYKGRQVWLSANIRGERERGDCDPEKLVTVAPYWLLKKPISVCASTANEATEISWQDSAGKTQTTHCDTVEGQKTGRCGCGPSLVFCFRPGEDNKLGIKSMKDEAARVAMEVIRKGLPYSTILTADWTMMNGRLEHFYAKLAGKLKDLKNPDTNRGWRRVNRPERHSGVLSSPAYFNFYFNGRRWAQRTYEAFMCHETTPDFDLLDEQENPPFLLYRDHPTKEPSPGVTEERACAACHLQLDSLARVKDRWDPFGQYFPTYEGDPIPQNVVFQGTTVDGVDEFGRALADSDIFKDCVVNQLWTHFVGHRFEGHETRIRKKLLADFKAKNLNFKHAIRAVTQTPNYRSIHAFKLMTRETYRKAMERITGVRWRIGKKRGFEVFYDKIGGMDYRVIEERDRTPGIGHSLVQYKAASETCDIAMDRDYDYSKEKRRMLKSVESLDVPTPKEIRALLEEWFLRIYARPADAVVEEEFKLLTDLFYDIRKKHTVMDGYKAVCTVMFASEDFAIF